MLVSAELPLAGGSLVIGPLRLGAGGYGTVYEGEMKQGVSTLRVAAKVVREKPGRTTAYLLNTEGSMVSEYTLLA